MLMNRRNTVYKDNIGHEHKVFKIVKNQVEIHCQILLEGKIKTRNIIDDS